MIRFSHTFSRGTVFVRCPENVEEEKQLNTLVQEVDMICRMTKNTGLWIVAEFQTGLKKAVVTSLKEKIEINSDEILTLQTEVLKYSQGDPNA